MNRGRLHWKPGSTTDYSAWEREKGGRGGGGKGEGGE
jgi:hypothetical protein